MGMTIAEKVLARTSGEDKVEAGDFVNARVDLHYNLETWLVEVEEKIRESGLTDGLPRLADPDRIAIMLGDHEGCHADPHDVNDYKKSREIAERYGIKNIFEINLGLAHVTVPEEGLARPGMLVCGKDSHTTACGAVNAMAVPVTTTETAWIYYTGELWFRVPESIKYVCEGSLQKGVVAKDIFLYTIGKYSPSFAQYRSLEWKGPVIDEMGMDGRLTLACQSLELGAKCAPFEPDEKCMEYVASTPRGEETYWPTPADPDSKYEKVIEEDFTSLEPQVAIPHNFDVVKPVSEVEGIEVDQCNLGSCANSRYDDIEIVAKIVEGRRVKARTIISPGSWKIYRRAIESGIITTLIDAGVMVMAPSCLPCDGRGACIADGEVAMGATTRNFLGRYGSPKAEIYLASPATTAATAVEGRITDPRELL